MSWLDRLLGREPERPVVQDAFDTARRAEAAIHEVQAAVDSYWTTKTDAAILAAYNAEQDRLEAIRARRRE